MPDRFVVDDPALSSDSRIVEEAAFSDALTRELRPDAVPTDVADALAEHRALPERLRRRRCSAYDESGELVGSTETTVDPDSDGNPDAINGGVFVVSERRRSGIGTVLLSHLVAFAALENRARILTATANRSGGAEFAAEVGAVLQQANHVSRLPIEDVDSSLMETWISNARISAPEYELTWWNDTVPDELIEQYCDLALVMNTAPRGQLAINDFTLTPAAVREREAQDAASGRHTWTVVAHRVTDGAWAGFHDVSWLRSEPHVLHVGSTGVQPAHRGKSLAKWLKAAMTLRIIEEQLEATEIRTANAESNDAMLAINAMMGFQRTAGTSTWELPVPVAKAWLDRRGNFRRGQACQA